MDKVLSSYLDQVDRRLRPLPAAERADIVQEIRSEMLELVVLPDFLHQPDGQPPQPPARTEQQGPRYQRQQKCHSGLTPEQICGRLGEPKGLAAAYLGDAIAKNPRTGT